MAATRRDRPLLLAANHRSFFFSFDGMTSASGSALSGPTEELGMCPVCHPRLVVSVLIVLVPRLVPRPELLVFGIVFIVVGIAFKFGAAPFHAWVPDVYQGSPTGVALFVAPSP